MPAAASETATRSTICTPEILTLDEVKRIVERQLAWIGLPGLAVGRIHRRADHRIEAEIVDPAGGGTHRRIFRASLIPASASTQTDDRAA